MITNDNNDNSDTLKIILNIFVKIVIIIHVIKKIT